MGFLSHSPVAARPTPKAPREARCPHTSGPALTPLVSDSISVRKPRYVRRDGPWTEM